MEKIVTGASFPTSSTSDWGSMNTHAIGNKVVMGLRPEDATGNVEVNVMFQVNGDKQYKNYDVTNQHMNLEVPEGTEYIEFNIQNVSGNSNSLNISVLEAA